MRGLIRRGGVVIIVVALIIGGAGAVSADTSPTDSDSEPDEEFDSEYIQLENLQTGETYYIDRGTGIDGADVPAGQYRASYYADGELVQRDVEIDSDGSVLQQDHTTTGIQTVVGRDSFQSSYGPNETVNIWTGVRNTSTAIPTPVAGVNLTITIDQPDGSTETFNRTTNQNGSVHLAYDLSQRPDGEYFIRVDSANYSEDFESFTAAPVAQELVPDNGRVTVGKTTTLEVLVSQAAEPVAGETRNVTIRRPDGTRSIQQVTTDQDGFAAFSFTPQQAGAYDFDVNGTSNVFAQLRAGAYIGTIYTNGDEFGTDVVQGNNLTISGTLSDGGQLAKNQTIKISVINQTNPSVAKNFTVQTDEFGQYLVKWDSSNESGDFTVRLYDANGQQVAVNEPFVEVVQKEENTDSGGDSPSSGPTLRLDIDAGDFDDTAVPGNTQSVSLRVTEDGDPVPNATVDIGTYYDFGNTPADGIRTVETNSTGQATFTVDVPADAPAGVNLEFEGAVSFNGSTDIDRDGTLIAPYSYRAVQQQFSAQAGDTVSINGTAFNSDTGAGVADVPGALFATSRGIGTSVVNTSFDRTGSDGRTVYNLTMPSNGQSVIAPIRSVYETRFGFFDLSEYSVAINGLDKFDYNTSETVTFNYTTTSSENVSAIVSVTTFDTINEKVLFEDRVEPGENVSVTIPSGVPDGTFYEIEVRSVSETGALGTEDEFFEVRQNRVAVSGNVENATGAPLSEQVVLAGSTEPADNDFQGDVLNSTGGFELSLLPDQNYSLTFVQNGTADLEPPRDGTADLFQFESSLSVSSATDIGTQTIPNGSVVEVKTVDESGAPVANATVGVLHRNGTGQPSPVLPATTNENGLLQFNQTNYTGVELTGNVTVKVQPPNRSRFVDTTYTRELQVTQDTNVSVTLNETAVDNTTSVSLSPSNSSAAVGDTTTVDVVVDDASDGVRSYEFNVTVANGSVGTIENVSLRGNPGFSNTTIDQQGTRLSVSAAAANTTNDTGAVVIATVTLNGTGDGTTSLGLSIDALGDENNDAYNVTGTNGGTLTVGGGPPPVGSSSSEPTDPDGDGKYEDVNGDGSFDVIDVSALFDNRGSSTVQNNTDAFDFNGDGNVDVIDVSALFDES